MIGQDVSSRSHTGRDAVVSYSIGDSRVLLPGRALIERRQSCRVGYKPPYCSISSTYRQTVTSEMHLDASDLYDRVGSRDNLVSDGRLPAHAAGGDGRDILVEFTMRRSRLRVWNR